MRAAFIRQLTTMALGDPRIHVILPDIGVFAFKQAGFPGEQTHNVGICEQLSINLASGMTIGAIGETLGANKKIPFSYTIAPFLLERAFEQIKMACYNNLPIKIVGVGAGLTYSHEGPTHHSLNDIALMRSLPNMVVYSPCSSEETALLTQEMVNNCKPSYIRLTEKPTQKYDYQYSEFRPISCVRYSSLPEVVIITTGGIIGNVLQAVDEIDKSFMFSVYSVSQLRPLKYGDLDFEAIFKGSKKIITVEEHGIGGLGSIIAELMQLCCAKGDLYTAYVQQDFCLITGTREEVLQWAGLTVDKLKEFFKCIAVL